MIRISRNDLRYFCQATLLMVLAIVISRPVDAQDTKRGIGAGDTFLSNSINSRWNYDWGYEKPSGLNGEFVPMFWSGGNLNTKINAIKGYGDTNYVLGFNEPERANQANMTVANAISQWATISNGFAGTGIKLVSPAVSDTMDGREWLDSFMNQVDADENLVVDEVAFHWYGTVNINNPTGNANSFLNKVDQYHENYDRPVWVTEFAGIDWGNNYTDEQMQAWNATFLEVAVAGLESRSHVTRYGWWNHSNDSRLVTKDSYGLWRPTEVGDHYYPTLLSGETRDMNGANLGLDMQYLRGGSLLNDGAALGNNALGRLYAMSNHDGSAAISQIGGSGDFGFHGWGSVRVEENANLRKVGTNTVSWRNLDLYHDGTIQLLGGSANAGSTLWIQGSGTNAQGKGKLLLHAGTNLRLGNSADSVGFTLPYEIEYRGGTVTIDGEGIVLDGDSTIFQQSFFEVNKDFTINGSFLGNAPGFVKRGDATMTLNGNAGFTGFTRVNGGTLAVNGMVLGNDVLVNNGGTLAGVGVIASDIVVADGGIVTPGNSAGILTAAGATFNDGSKLILELASITDFDRLVLTDVLDVDEGAFLEIDLLDGFMPTVGDQFDVLDFASFNGQFVNISAPSLGNGQWDFSQLNATGIISFVAVPEPSAMALGLMGMIVAMTRRRRI